jgi:hypothetical protein
LQRICLLMTQSGHQFDRSVACFRSARTFPGAGLGRYDAPV